MHVINRCTPSIHSCTTFTTCRIHSKFGTTRIAVALLRIILCHHSASCDVAALNSFQLKPIGVPVDCHASNQRIQFRENNEERARRLVGVGYRAFSPKANQSVWIFSTRSGDALQVTFPSSVALSHPLPSSHSSLPPKNSCPSARMGRTIRQFVKFYRVSGEQHIGPSPTTKRIFREISPRIKTHLLCRVGGTGVHKVAVFL